MYTFCNSPGRGGRGGGVRLPSKRDGNARWELLNEPFRGTNVFWARLEFFSPLRCTKATTAHQLLLLILPYFFNSEKGDFLLVCQISPFILFSAQYPESLWYHESSCYGAVEMPEMAEKSV